MIGKLWTYKDLRQHMTPFCEGGSDVCVCLHRVLHLTGPHPPQTSQQASQGGLRGG